VVTDVWESREALDHRIVDPDRIVADAHLCLALKRVAAGTMEPNVGSAMAGIAKTVVGIRTTGDFEKRLDALERTSGIGNVRRIGA